MMRRVLVVLGAVALLVLVSALDTQAARYRSSGQRGLRRPHAPRQSAARRVAKPSLYPRVRQIDGRALWDLGKQKGQWPSLR